MKTLGFFMLLLLAPRAPIVWGQTAADPAAAVLTLDRAIALAMRTFIVPRPGPRSAAGAVLVALALGGAVAGCRGEQKVSSRA